MRVDSIVVSPVYSCLLRYKLDDVEVLSGMDRVTAVPGDLSRPLLGLDNVAFKASKLVGLRKIAEHFEHKSQIVELRINHK